jgi:hypothetical protein
VIEDTGLVGDGKATNESLFESLDWIPRSLARFLGWPAISGTGIYRRPAVDGYLRVLYFAD